MRNIARIDPFIEELGEKWKTYFPDWRFGQMMYNFMSWMMGEKKIDPFFPEEQRMMELFDEFIVDSCGGKSKEQ